MLIIQICLNIYEVLYSVVALQEERQRDKGRTNSECFRSLLIELVTAPHKMPRITVTSKNIWNIMKKWHICQSSKVNLIYCTDSLNRGKYFKSFFLWLWLTDIKIWILHITKKRNIKFLKDTMDPQYLCRLWAPNASLKKSWSKYLTSPLKNVHCSLFKWLKQ